MKNLSGFPVFGLWIQPSHAECAHTRSSSALRLLRTIARSRWELPRLSEQSGRKHLNVWKLEQSQRQLLALLCRQPLMLPSQRSSGRRRRVGRCGPPWPLSVEVLAFPFVQLLDVAGPLQVFSSANERAAEQGRPPLYDVHVIAPQAQVDATAGLIFGASPLPPPEAAVDTFIVAGGQGVRARGGGPAPGRLRGRRTDDCLFPSRSRPEEHISTRQYARLVGRWVAMIDLEPRAYGAHSLRRTKVALVYKKTGNLRACQLLLGQCKLESTVRYLGIEVDDALALSEQVDL